MKNSSYVITGFPGWFAWRSLRRVVYLWTGFWSFEKAYLAEEPLDPANIPVCTALTVLALLGFRRLWRDKAELAFPYAALMIFFPLIYYVTSPESYYRRPLDTILVVLAASFLGLRGKRNGEHNPDGLEQFKN